MSNNLIDLKGRKFERLTVIKRDYNDPRSKKRPTWLCRCECGIEKIISGVSLREGHAKSCGCLRREKRMLDFGIANMRKVIINYKINAKNRNIEYKLTEEQFKKLTQKPCYYCGTKPNNVAKSPHNNGDYIYNGLDRIDNKKGYTIDNVVPCCYICNYAKNMMSLKEFKEWIKRVYNKIFLT